VNPVLLDTHAWVWATFESRRLSPLARAALSTAESVCLSAISFYEITRKAALGQWPEMVDRLGELPALLVEQQGREIALDGVACRLAGTLAWDHRDPFDRIIAAVALTTAMPLVSADPAFDALKGPYPAFTRLW